MNNMNSKFTELKSKLVKLGWNEVKTNLVGSDGECCTVFNNEISELSIWHKQNKVIGTDRFEYKVMLKF